MKSGPDVFADALVPLLPVMPPGALIFPDCQNLWDATRGVQAGEGTLPRAVDRAVNRLHPSLIPELLWFPRQPDRGRLSDPAPRLSAQTLAVDEDAWHSKAIAADGYRFAKRQGKPNFAIYE